MSDQAVRLRYIVNVYGIVQGVGFRPFVFNKAKELGLCGYVNNNGSSLCIDIEGIGAAVKCFVRALVKTPPPLAHIERVTIKKAELRFFDSFTIVQSSSEDRGPRFIPRDTATCDNCLEDIENVQSAWYHYPFTNCTDCGPRYSIIEDLPYDRCNTTMKPFKMCPDCREQYENPKSRRFHAQPICCPTCGPGLQLISNKGGTIVEENTLDAAAELIKQGKIVAVKGIGGFHLICNGEDGAAIDTLRVRKNRLHKALAVMAADMHAIELQCEVSERERLLLKSPQCPIVLLKRKACCTLPQNIAPDLDTIGFMLPHTPLHHLLFSKGIKYLIATSGNKSGMPIEYKNDEVVKNLPKIADTLLLHNRDIHVPIDDAVTKVFQGKEMISRIGRGYAPLSIFTGINQQLAALGAEQKNTISLSKDGYAYTSQYLGDIKSPAAYTNYCRTLQHLMKLLKVRPEAFVHDLHPQYLSTQYAQEQLGQQISVQHHFAHMAGCMEENKLKKPAIGVIYDGTGYGTDGCIWGGELLVGNQEGFIRTGHLKYCSLQGGDKAVEEPWRTAVSYLQAIDCKQWMLSFDLESSNFEAVTAALEGGLNCFRSSSIGRLFDCVSALLGLCSSISYDAQAAMRLENIADKDVHKRYEFGLYWEEGQLNLGYEEMLWGILGDIKKGEKASVISGKFHYAIADATLAAVIEIGAIYGIKDVVLSGGCFENQLLLGLMIERLEKEGYRVYMNEKLPCNDGGISFGQLAAGSRILRG